MSALARNNGRVAFESGLSCKDSNPYQASTKNHVDFIAGFRACQDAAFAAKYPLHVELKAREVEARTLGAFLDWLDEKGLTICVEDGRGFSDYQPDYVSKEKRIGAFMEIDPDALEAEKRAMLAELCGT